MRRESLVIMLLILSLQLWSLGVEVHGVSNLDINPPWAGTDVTGGTSSADYRGASNVYAFPITIHGSGLVQSIGVNWADSGSVNFRVALYASGVAQPTILLTQSADVETGTRGGWQDVPVMPYSVSAGGYWVAVAISGAKKVYTNQAMRRYYPKPFGPFDSVWSNGSGVDNVDQWNVRVSYYQPQPFEPTEQINPVPASLPVTDTTGSYWSGNGIAHRALNGTGNYAGNWTMDMQYTNKFIMTRRDANVATVVLEHSATWSRTATDTWIVQNAGNSSIQGSVGPVNVYYTIDLRNMRITDVSSNQLQSGGHLTYLFIDPQAVRQGGNVSGDWYGAPVPFHVGASRNVLINGVIVAAWPVTYARDWYGYWHVGSHYSTGSVTRTNLYDKTYCVVVGWEIVGNYVYAGTEGSWTETYFDYFRVTDSNFLTPSKITQPSPTPFPLQPNLAIAISVTVIVLMIAFLVIRKQVFRQVISRLRKRRFVSLDSKDGEGHVES